MDVKEMETATGLEIAVIGMAGRFPGAKNIDEFWEILKNGREVLSFYSDDELRGLGVSEELIKNPGYIRSYGWLDGIEEFDASFFGYTPLEAEIMDPQVRIFHECVFQALEDAGYDSYTYKKLIGLYAGASANFDWQASLELSGKNDIFGRFVSKQLNDKDFLCMRIAHKLNLNGPALIVDTACSTSLTAVHMAGQGLLSGDCDMALAGGVSIGRLNKAGYLYLEGMPNSPDGHCRAFDARAQGTNFGNASAVVVLKRLDDAAADGDSIYAVIKGSSIDNDGNRKAAFTAPSIEGLAGAVRTALRMAEVEPESIGCIEAHGTGTSLGDPVEIEGLKAAFNTAKKHFCRIGSVKTNVGHLETAAGVTGFIKAVLTLKHRFIPPSLFFERPNPKIDFENSPFIVNSEPLEWKRDKYPLRAGVSSYGIGGTNVHVVLEEAPLDSGSVGRWAGESVGKEYRLLLLSAGTESALDQMTKNLAEHLKKHPGIDLADTAYTLQVGRRLFKHRRMLVCSDVNEAIEVLSAPDSHPGKSETHRSEEDNAPLVFMFPGLKAFSANMGRELYEKEPLFQKETDRCFSVSPAAENPPAAFNRHLSLFSFEYALAKLLIHWGIKPYAMKGEGVGEYVSACLSDKLSLEEALKAVAAAEEGNVPPLDRNMKGPEKEGGAIVVEVGREISELYFLLKRIGKLWLYGQPIDWAGFYGEEKRRRISLPGYPFQGQRFWLEPIDWAKISNLQAPAAVSTPKKTRYQRPDLDTEYTAPRDETERALADIWSGFFGFHRVGIRDNFLALGGDSLMALAILPKIHQVLKKEIPLPEFFKRLTIESLAQFLGDVGTGDYLPIEPAEKKEYYPLSSAQMRLYILQQMETGSTAYNESSIIPVTVDHEPAQLDHISRQLIKRHESLRTSFRLVNDKPVQKIHPFDDMEFEVEYYDLTVNGDKKQNFFIRSFDLARAPLVRVGLVKKGPGEYLLVVDMHHIITDASSMVVFIKDLTIIDSSAGETLLPLRVQYKEYAEWQNHPRQKEAVKKQEKFWLEHFAGDLPQLNLPFKGKRTPGYGARGYVKGEIPEAAAEKLQGVAKREDATLFMVFMAVYNIFLSRITGAEDIVVGTLTVGRSHTDLGEVIGMFVNTLALRNFPTGELTFKEFLGEVKNRTLEAFANQDYQFDDLVDRVVKSREPGRNPLFDAAFAFYSKQWALDDEIPISDGITRGIVEEEQAKFDIVLNAGEKKDSLYLSLDYNSRLFSEEAAERFFHYILDICSIVGEDRGIKIKDIKISHELSTAGSKVIEEEEGDFGF